MVDWQLSSVDLTAEVPDCIGNSYGAWASTLAAETEMFKWRKRRRRRHFVGLTAPLAGRDTTAL
jgi:hypothetical protein